MGHKMSLLVILGVSLAGFFLMEPLVDYALPLMGVTPAQIEMAERQAAMEMVRSPFDTWEIIKIFVCCITGSYVFAAIFAGAGR